MPLNLSDIPHGYRMQRWLAQDAPSSLPADAVLREVVPDGAWVTWEQARDHLAGCLLAEVEPVYGPPADIATYEPWWASNRAEMLLTDAIRRGVLTLSETLVPREPGVVATFCSHLGAALRRRSRQLAAWLRLGPAPDTRLEHAIDDLLHAMEDGATAPSSSERPRSCHPRDHRKTGSPTARGERVGQRGRSRTMFRE